MRNGSTSNVRTPIVMSCLHRWRNVCRMASQIMSYYCLLNRLSRQRSKITSKPRVTGLCGGNSSVTCEFPAQRASNAENVSIWWRHYVCRVSCGGVFNMLLVLSITFYFHYNIRGCMCQLAHFIIGDWKDISIANAIIIIKSEVSTFPIVIMFFRGCVSEMFVISYSITYCIYIPG